MERKMKDSGIPWIGEIPEHWEICKLSNFLTQFTEKNHADKPLLSVTRDKGVIPRGEKGDDDNHNVIPEDLSGYKHVLPGDFIINKMKSWQGSYGLTDFEGIVSPSYFTYHLDFTHKKFFSIALRSSAYIPFFSMFSKGIRVDQWDLIPEALKMFPFFVPPVAEQEQIASYLDEKCDEIDELIDVEQQMISDLESYRQAVITEAVTHGLNHNAPKKHSTIQGIKDIPSNWNEVNLLKVIYLRARLGWRGLKAEEYVDEGYPFLSAFNIVNNQLVWENLNFINQLRYDESPEIKLSLHDILIVKDGAGIGKCARVENMPLGESTVNSSLGVITVSDTLYYSYLYYFFLSTPFQDNVLFLKNGMGVPHLTQENLKSVRIPLPPVDEQRAIAKFLDGKCSEIDGLIQVKQEKIETLKQYRQSLIFEAVTGKTLITNNA